jgi:two-component system chemotaxis response regulator CheY
MEGRRVLAIEHDWRMRKLIRANLEALGVEVQEAVTGQHGLELLSEGNSDLILLDLDLPDLDVLHLLGGLQARIDGRRVPVIVISTEPPGRRLKHHRHIVGHVLKPFAVPALLEQIRKALTEGQMGD